MTKFFAQWRSGRSVIFRPLTWAEFQKFERELHFRRPADVFLDVYRAVVLQGPRERDLTAGIVEFVGHSAMDHNPFNGQYEDIKRAIDLKRGEVQGDYLLSAKAVVAALFQIPLEQIEGWDAEKFFEYVAMAEFVSGRKLEPGNPEQKKPTKPTSKTSVPNQAPTQETRPSEEPAPRLRRPLTPAQRLVLDRVQQARQG